MAEAASGSMAQNAFVPVAAVEDAPLAIVEKALVTTVQQGFVLVAEGVPAPTFQRAPVVERQERSLKVCLKGEDLSFQPRPRVALELASL